MFHVKHTIKSEYNLNLKNHTMFHVKHEILNKLHFNRNKFLQALQFFLAVLNEAALLLSEQKLFR